ncbi:hypothetical protein [Streptomyces sp. WAC 04229]|uniref:hypothetical protein n=1 Tax=Streptomyces sp. WAC 04229 TaxID=2203206 RepID=UPI003D713760
MSSSPGARVNRTFFALQASLVGTGACAGFLLGAWSDSWSRGWWGAGLGAGIAALGTQMLMISYQRRILASLLSAPRTGSGAEEGISDAVAAAVSVYEAAMFPLTPGGVSAQEQKARRTIAYRLTAYYYDRFD